MAAAAFSRAASAAQAGPAATAVGPSGGSVINSAKSAPVARRRIRHNGAVAEALACGLWRNRTLMKLGLNMCRRRMRGHRRMIRIGDSRAMLGAMYPSGAISNMHGIVMVVGDEGAVYESRMIMPSRTHIPSRPIRRASQDNNNSCETPDPIKTKRRRAEPQDNTSRDSNSRTGDPQIPHGIISREHKSRRDPRAGFRSPAVPTRLW